MPVTNSADGVPAPARSELALTIVLWGMAAAFAATTAATPLLIGLVSWQGSVYASAPFMSWLDQHGHLTPELERRRRTEQRRERFAAIARPVAFGSLGAIGVGAAAFAIVLAIGASHPGTPNNPFTTPKAGPGDSGPFGLVSHPSSASTTTTTTTPTRSTTTSTSSTTTTTSTTSTTSTTTAPPGPGG